MATYLIDFLKSTIMEKHKHLVPAILSAVIPGLGQIVKGQIVKGLLIIVLGATVSFLLFWTIVFPILLWAWNVYDAYTSDSEKSFVNDTSKRMDVR
jgi:TM2 domain-containing membrane protein YozV